MRVVLTGWATAELEEATSWYANHDWLASQNFTDAFLHAARSIAENPRLWPEIEAEVRRALLRKYPYSLIFVIRGDEALVLSVMHQSREPGYWRDRLG
ncbi:type II toxin-antitoxin system RelE/ParE family toxin [Nannocystaceae bacterium ST9]